MNRLTAAQTSILKRSLLRVQTRSIFFHFRKEEENLYTILSVKPSTKQKDIKLAYYKMAKKYHPDFLQGDDVTEKEKEEANEMFKKIQKSYEVLSNPIARQAYDIENNMNDGGDGHTVDQTIYEDTTAKRSYFQPKQQKDFYHTKWTNYQKPDWYHPYNGIDARSEFLYMRKNSDYMPWWDQTRNQISDNRLLLYISVFLLYSAYDLYKDFRQKAVQDMDLELLNDSYNLEKSETKNIMAILMNSAEGQRQQKIAKQSETSLMSLVQSIDGSEDEEDIKIDIDENVKQYLNSYI